MLLITHVKLLFHVTMAAVKNVCYSQKSQNIYLNELSSALLLSDNELSSFVFSVVQSCDASTEDN